MSRVLVAVSLFLAFAARAQDPVPPPPAAPATTTPDAELSAEQRYKRGKNLFEYGDYAGTEATLAPLAVPGQLQDEKWQLDVHRMLGICYALDGKQLEAAREFSSLLSINPDFALDPFLTPPGAIEIFDRQKAAMKAQLEELRRVREKDKGVAIDEHGGVLVERSTTVKQIPLAVSFMPFGLAQAANGSTAKAVIFGAIEGATLAATVALYWTSIGLETLDPKFNETDDSRNTYNGVVAAQFVSAMAFALAYGVGVGDALWNRDDGAVVETKQTRRNLTPDELKDGTKISPP